MVYLNVQIDVKDKKESSTTLQIFTFFAVVLIVGLPIYGYFKLKPENIPNQEEEIVEEEEITNDSELVEEETTPIMGEGYVEELVEIDGQWAYIVAPAYTDTSNLPTLVIYNHGSITFVEENMDEVFKSNLLAYGEAFTVHNYIFAVSNAHGVNWGNLDSLNDNYSMYEYIKEEYGIKDDIYSIGFSMGGLPTMNFATTYPEMVSKIALLAPTTRTSEWDQERVDKVKDIDIKIWHGDKDINVGLIYTQSLVNKIEALGKSIDLVILEGKTHWDMDGYYIYDILEFFSN